MQYFIICAGRNYRVVLVAIAPHRPQDLSDAHAVCVFHALLPESGLYRTTPEAAMTILLYRTDPDTPIPPGGFANQLDVIAWICRARGVEPPKLEVPLYGVPTGDTLI